MRFTRRIAFAVSPKGQLFFMKDLEHARLLLDMARRDLEAISHMKDAALPAGAV
jgi:hypothetical protein